MNYYFDMDGVFVKYERIAYEGENPQFTRLGFHYYKNLSEDTKMIKVMKALNDETQNKSSDNELRVLTSVSKEGLVYMEQCDDKLYWSEQHTPFLRPEQFIFAVSGKRRIAELLKGKKLTPKDVLTDDFNPNLIDWQNAGGTAVKYCNGLNSPDSFNGFCITEDMSADDILRFYKSIERSYTAFPD